MDAIVHEQPLTAGWLDVQTLLAARQPLHELGHAVGCILAGGGEGSFAKSAVVGISTGGCKRRNRSSEDGVGYLCVYPKDPRRPPVRIFVVTDGYGDSRLGYVAARLAQQCVMTAILEGYNGRSPGDLDRFVVRGMTQAHAEVVALRPPKQEMGTTCTVVAVQGHETKIWWVGDSPAFVLPRNNASGRSLFTAPHNGSRRPLRTERDFITNPLRWSLSRAIGAPCAEDSFHTLIDRWSYRWANAGGVVGAVSDAVCFDNAGLSAVVDAYREALGNLARMATRVLEPIFADMPSQRPRNLYDAAGRFCAQVDTKQDHTTLVLLRVPSWADYRATTWRTVGAELRRSGLSRQEIAALQRTSPNHVHAERLRDIADYVGLPGELLPNLRRIGVLGW